MKDYLDYTKLTWDIDYNSSASPALSDVTFAASDIDTAVVTNDTTLTVKLTSAALRLPCTLLRASLRRVTQQTSRTQLT